MAHLPIGAGSTPANPGTDWLRACEALELARRDALEDVESDEEIMLLGGAQSEACTTLILTPAPDVEAVAHKLQVFRDEECYNLVEESVQEYLDAIIADVRRLATEAHNG